MGLPTIEQYRAGNGKWNRTHRGIGYELSHHGVSDYQPQGTWCYYLHLRPDQFQSANDFAKFDAPAMLSQAEPSGLWYNGFAYDGIPDLNFHGGVTWFSKEPYFDKQTDETRQYLNIGCDYAHSWDRDSGYWQGLDEVDADAKRSIDCLFDMCPMNERCAYSGTFDHPDNFYTAVNGHRVRRWRADSFSDEMSGWREADQATPASAS